MNGWEEVRNVAGVVLGEYSWGTNTSWATLEGIFTIPLSCSSGGLETYALAGFRWDNWQTTWRNPVRQSGLIGARNGTDVATADVNGYIPYVGLLTRMGGVTFSACAFPAVFGNARHSERVTPAIPGGPVTSWGTFKKGYFLETRAEYTLPVPVGDSDVWFSAFFTYNVLEAGMDINYDDSANPTSKQDFRFYRKLFVLGGKAELAFAPEDLIPW
jgi:hypothetical protein